MVQKISTKEQEELYSNIVDLYDLSEEVLNHVQCEEEADSAIPLAQDIGDATDDITDGFLSAAQFGQANSHDQAKVEGGLRKIFSSIQQFAQKTQAKDAEFVPTESSPVLDIEDVKNLKAYELVEDPASLFQSEDAKEVIETLSTSPSGNKKLLKSVISVRMHAEVVMRACLNPVVGLVNQALQAEPKPVQTDVESKSTKSFAARIAKETAERDNLSKGR